MSTNKCQELKIHLTNQNCNTLTFLAAFLPLMLDLLNVFIPSLFCPFIPSPLYLQKDQGEVSTGAAQAVEEAMHYYADQEWPSKSDHWI